MPWVRFDDQFSINRKIARLSDAAFRLHTVAVFWCARNLTDGVIPTEDLEDVAQRMRTPGRLVSELLRRDLWHEIGSECESVNCPAHPDNVARNAVTNGVTGWVVHDYLEYQPSKDRVRQDRTKSAERQRRFRERNMTPQQQRTDNGMTSAPETRARNTETQVEEGRNAVTNGGSNGAPSRPDPYKNKNTPPPTADPPKGAETPKAEPAPKSQRGTRLPDEFPVTPEMAAWAREKTPTCGTADHEAFGDYWRGTPGAKGRKLDWTATWRNWMRRAHGDRTRRNGSSRPAGRPGPDDRFAQIQALKHQPGRLDPEPQLNLIRGELA